MKPGGYERTTQLAEKIEPLLAGKFHGIDLESLERLAESVTINKYHVKSARPVGSRKTKSILPLYDCAKAPCKDGGCPIEQQIPEYLKLVSEGNYEEAFKVIVNDNASPAVTGTICDHQCQHKCTRLDYDSPLEIRNAKKIAVLNAQDKYLANMKKAKIVTFETESDATSEVLNGKADAMVYDQPYNVVFMSDKGKDKLVHLDTSLTYEPLGFAIRKGDPDFLNWLNNFIRQSKEDKVVGFSDELYNKWLVDTSWLQRVQ